MVQCVLGSLQNSAQYLRTISFARRAERVSLSKRAPNSGTCRSAVSCAASCAASRQQLVEQDLNLMFYNLHSQCVIRPRSVSFIVYCAFVRVLLVAVINFPAWMEGDEPSWSKGSTVTGGSKPKMPRSYHKKSRTGCQRCRARRVKASLFSFCLESFMNCLSSCDPKLLHRAKKISVDDDYCLTLRK